MPIDQVFSLDGLEPSRANYNALCPTGEGRWECIAQNVVRGIHICMNRATIGRHELGPQDALPTIVGMVAYGLQVQKGAFGGVAFIANDDLDPG